MNQVLPILFYEDISDHLLTSAIITCNSNKKATKRPYTRKITQENLDLFLSELNVSLNSPEMCK